MKLAEALGLRADLQKRISQLEERLKTNVRIQEGEEPAEDPDELLKALNTALAQLEDLIFRINLTNMETLSQGEVLTSLIARKDVLSLRISVLRNVLAEAAGTNNRYSMNEIRYIRTVNVAQMQKYIDDLSRTLRELDVRIQQANWNTDLL